MLQVNVSGNITADAAIKIINGKSCISFTIANNTSRTSADGTLQQKTDFLSCTVWGKPNAAPLFFKGRPITISGLLDIKAGTSAVFLNVNVLHFKVFGKGRTNPRTEAETVTVPTVDETPESLTYTTSETETKDLPF